MPFFFKYQNNTALIGKPVLSFSFCCKNFNTYKIYYKIRWSVTNHHELPQTTHGTYILHNLITDSASITWLDLDFKSLFLGRIQSFPVANKDISYKTVEEKYSKQYRTYLYDPETLEPFSVMLSNQKIAKFQKDRYYLQKVLSETMAEMMQTYSCKKLQQRNEEYKQSVQEENEFLLEADQNKREAERLRYTLDNEKVDNAIEIERINKRIASIIDGIEV